MNSKRKGELMEGKTFNYGGRIHYIEYVKFDDAAEKMTMKTNLEVYSRPYGSVDVFLEQFVPIETLSATVVSSPAVVVADRKSADDQNESALVRMAEKDTAVADDLIAMLKSNIAKVQADPSYIPQAQEINRNVNSILNIVKTKMDMARQYSKKR